MSTSDTFELLGIALVLGLLVGMPRERVEAPLAGLRTFALITVLGTMCGLLAKTLGDWIIVANLIGGSAAMVVGNIINLKRDIHDPGVTTEIAMLVMFIVGTYLVFGPHEVAVAVGGGTAVLLHAKGYMRGFLRRLGDAEFRAVMQVVLISLVILPVLPNRPFGPFQVLNLRQIWWMVVLVSAISFGGYLAMKFLGHRAGIPISGLLGGLISSTATTVSYSRRAAASEGHVDASMPVIMLASVVVYIRILAEVALVAPSRFREIAPPILVMLGGSLDTAAMACGGRRPGVVNRL